MGFPDTWPMGCPPDDAEVATGVVFRLVQENPPTAEHFQSFAEQGRRLKKPTACPCMPFGLSVFRDRDDAEHMARLYPFLGKFIAQGTLTEEDGVTKLTPGQRPTHTTWWPEEGIEREKPFDQVEEII